MTPTTIRKATASDFPRIHELIMEFAHFQKHPEYVTVTIEQMIENQQFFNCLVAEVSGTIVGFASWFPAYYSWSGRAVYLDDLYVTGSYRGAGIGVQLFNAVEVIARQENCIKMRWLVSRWNEKAIGFYRSKGAEIDDMEMICTLVL